MMTTISAFISLTSLCLFTLISPAKADVLPVVTVRTSISSENQRAFVESTFFSSASDRYTAVFQFVGSKKSSSARFCRISSDRLIEKCFSVAFQKDRSCLVKPYDGIGFGPELRRSMEYVAAPGGLGASAAALPTALRASQWPGRANDALKASFVLKAKVLRDVRVGDLSIEKNRIRAQAEFACNAIWRTDGALAALSEFRRSK